MKLTESHFSGSLKSCPPRRGSTPAVSSTTFRGGGAPWSVDLRSVLGRELLLHLRRSGSPPGCCCLSGAAPATRLLRRSAAGFCTLSRVDCQALGAPPHPHPPLCSIGLCIKKHEVKLQMCIFKTHLFDLRVRVRVCLSGCVLR